MASGQRVGFLGLGLMGRGMTKNLATKGFQVTVWNRSRARATALEPLGVKVADTPAQLMAAVEVACTCVATPAALEQVVSGKDGLLSAARPGQLLIDFSTIGPDQARSLAERAAAAGVDFVEAPVTGSKNGAEKGTLLIMAGGTEAALARAEPVFRAVGEKWIHCGPVGAGSQVKLAGNALIAAMLQALGEGMLLATRAGVDPAKVLEVAAAQRLSEYAGLIRRRSTAMPRTSTVHAVTTVGMDMGKNTLHMIGLDSHGAIVLRERRLARTHYVEACQSVALSDWHRSGNGNALRCSRACRAWPRREAGAAQVCKAVSAGAQE